MTGRILRSQENKLRSIATKVMLQVCAKLGGEPWQLDLPNQVLFPLLSVSCLVLFVFTGMLIYLFVFSSVLDGLRI